MSTDFKTGLFNLKKGNSNEIFTLMCHYENHLIVLNMLFKSYLV